MKQSAAIAVLTLAIFATAGSMLVTQSGSAAAEEIVADVEETTLANVLTADEAGPCPFGKEGMGGHHEGMLERKAELFGMTVEELQAQLDEGKHFFEIAEEQGLTLTDLQEHRAAIMEERLQEKIDSGFLTSEQAEEFRTQMEEKQDGLGMHGGFGRGHGMRGMF